MRNARVFLLIAALANLAVTLWHLRLSVDMHPGLLGAASVRIAIQTGIVTLIGVALLWTRYRTIGSLLLIAIIGIGFVIGCLEHFFVTGPYNVFDAGSGDWVLPWKVSVALLVVVQVAGLSAAGRMLLARPSA
jgi:hypothetical protein